MKYQIGDIVKIKYMRISDYDVLQNKIGLIIEKQEDIDYIDYDDPTTAYPFTKYKVIIAGIEGNTYTAYEQEIEKKIE